MDLHVDETGPNDAPTIVFVHGGGGAGWMWRPQVEALAQYHVLVPDLPEHGRSMTAAPFTVAGSMAAIAELVRTRAHGRRATIIGLSEGAQITLALLASQPEIVDRAIVSSALVRGMPGAWMMSPRIVAWAYKLTVAPFKNSEWWMRANMRGAAGVPEEFADDYRRAFKATTAESLAHVITENQSFRLPAGLDRVTVPVLAVCGRGEYSVMRRSTADVAAAIPGAEAYEAIHDRKMSVAEEHNWSMQDPQLFNAMVRAWMTGDALPAGLRPLVL